jgi:hypothetical protein
VRQNKSWKEALILLEKGSWQMLFGPLPEQVSWVTKNARHFDTGA